MGNILTRWRVSAKSVSGPMLNAEMVVRTESAAKAIAIVQQMLDESQATGLEIYSVEEIKA